MNMYNYFKKISLFIEILIYTPKVFETNKTFKWKLSHPRATSCAPVYIITDKETNPNKKQDKLAI